MTIQLKTHTPTLKITSTAAALIDTRASPCTQRDQAWDILGRG